MSDGLAEGIRALLVTATGERVGELAVRRLTGGASRETWLAENGPELVHLPRGAKVTPAAQTRRMMGGANGNRPIVLQHFDLSQAVTTEQLMRDMDERSQAAAAQATQAGISELIDQNRRSYGQLLSANG